MQKAQDEQSGFTQKPTVSLCIFGKLGSLILKPKHMADLLLQNPTQKLQVRIVLLSWLLVGTLDICSAFIDYYIATGKNPLNVLTYIASGAFGKSASSGGWGMILTGLFFHYFFALCFTLLFFWLYPRIDLLSKNRIVTGIVYGIFIWLVMNLVVVQLSSAPHRPINAIKISKAIKAVLILIFMIGLPLSFVAYKYFSGNTKKKSN